MAIKNFYSNDTNRPFRLTGVDGYATRGYAESNIAGETFKVNDIIRLGDDVLYGYSLDFYEYWVPVLGGACRAKLCYMNLKQPTATPSIYLTLKTGLGGADTSESKFVAESASAAGDTIRNSQGVSNATQTSIRTCGAPLKNTVFPALVITTAHGANEEVGAGTAPQYSVIQFGDHVSWSPNAINRR